MRRGKDDESRVPVITAILQAEVAAGRQLEPPDIADVIGPGYFRDAENRAEIIERVARCKASTPYRLLAEEHDLTAVGSAITIDESSPIDDETWRTA